MRHGGSYSSLHLRSKSTSSSPFFRPYTYSSLLTPNSYLSYNPFGMLMPGRNGSQDQYRYGFNGQEKEKDITGTESHYSAEYWMYDSRLGRRWNLDPVDQVDVSNYACFLNNPCYFIDPKGDHVEYGEKGSSRKERRDTKREVKRARRADEHFNEAFKQRRKDHRRLKIGNDNKTGKFRIKYSRLPSVRYVMEGPESDAPILSRATNTGSNTQQRYVFSTAGYDLYYAIPKEWVAGGVYEAEGHRKRFGGTFSAEQYVSKSGIDQEMPENQRVRYDVEQNDAYRDIFSDAKISYTEDENGFLLKAHIVSPYGPYDPVSTQYQTQMGGYTTDGLAIKYAIYAIGKPVLMYIPSGKNGLILEGAKIIKEPHEGEKVNQSQPYIKYKNGMYPK
ncbi:MAG TPA: RHS repeat-associated core domain-containing protein [Flavobacteriales bacterium]|nr:RHS repeat-associated core domain-containing protein [Flavobacteriales bacterium]HRJ37892.1 RHS repeat-associated core domain-containing protein [Flavobacteriales bacterium]